MTFYEDDRVQSLHDVFDILPGQVNVTYQRKAGQVVAWHKHNIQTDYWCVVRGSFRVGICCPSHMYMDNARKVFDKNGDEYLLRWEYLSDKNFRTIRIEPGYYHGYMPLEDDSIMLYYLDRDWEIFPTE